MPSHAHHILMEKLLRFFVGAVAYWNGYCPECLEDLKGIKEKPCHVCNVVGYIKPNRIWNRFNPR
jgi:hypothetical protein